MVKKAISIKTKETKTRPTRVKKPAGLTIPVFDKEGKKTGSLKVPAAIFGQKENPALIAQAMRVFLARQKPATASTKTRAEVRGGGAKPWRQKGTGRARVGSRRVPNWRGGGVVFGPKPLERILEMPKKMRQKALAVALSGKLREESVVVVEGLDFKEPKTKKAASVLEKVPLKQKKTILVILEKDSNSAEKSFRNIENVNLAKSVELNTFDVLKSSGLIFTPKSVENFLKRFEAKESKND